MSNKQTDINRVCSYISGKRASSLILSRKNNNTKRLSIPSGIIINDTRICSDLQITFYRPTGAVMLGHSLSWKGKKVYISKRIKQDCNDPETCQHILKQIKNRDDYRCARISFNNRIAPHVYYTEDIVLDKKGNIHYSSSLAGNIYTIEEDIFKETNAG